MNRKIILEATLSGNVNKIFRINTRFYHIIHRNTSLKKIPVIINNFNRLEYLQQQVEWLLSLGISNIHIIDNASTYKPLLAYYKKIPATVYFLDRNVGHEALWRTHLFQRFGKYYHIYTDPDLLPDKNTPIDFMSYFKDILDRYPLIKKVGFGLRTDDLPNHYPKKQEVIKWEAQFKKDQVENGIYKARIDTTFALYRPGASFQCWDDTLRTAEPYLLKHMPWYENPNTLNEEAKYYIDNATRSSSWYKSLKGDNDVYEI